MITYPTDEAPYLLYIDCKINGETFHSCSTMHHACRDLVHSHISGVCCIFAPVSRMPRKGMDYHIGRKLAVSHYLSSVASFLILKERLGRISGSHILVDYPHRVLGIRSGPVRRTPETESGLSIQIN